MEPQVSAVLASDAFWLLSPIGIPDRNAVLIFQLPAAFTALWPSAEWGMNQGMLQSVIL